MLTSVIRLPLYESTTVDIVINLGPEAALPTPTLENPPLSDSSLEQGTTLISQFGVISGSTVKLSQSPPFMQP